jgi:predicted transposase YbfD/YdcC
MASIAPPTPEAPVLQALIASATSATTLAPAADDLVAAFADGPDPRRAQGRRFPLPAVLALAGAAILATHLSVRAIAPWGARQRPAVLQARGFRDGKTPHQAPLQRLVRKLAPAPLSAAVGRYFAAAAPNPQERGGPGVAIDGKAQRGRLAFATTSGGSVHALTAYSHESGVVPAQEEIRRTAEQAEAELTGAPARIARLAWRGRGLTGDARFCQRHLCTQVLAAGGDYLRRGKANQPTLHEDIRLLFEPPAAGPPPLPLLDRRAAVTVERGHGRTDDRRHLIAATALAGYSDWPGWAQVFRLERTWRARGVAKRAVHYGITSLPPAAAAAARWLTLKRGHRGIENRLHYVKDVVLAEDASQVRLGAGPTVLPTLRDTALRLLRWVGCRKIAERLREHSQHPAAAVAVLLRHPPQNA